MLAQGHSLKAIADVLGHRHLESTFIYTKVDFEHLKQVKRYPAYPPPYHRDAPATLGK
jgi:site-specific recombinase XerC